MIPEQTKRCQCNICWSYGEYPLYGPDPEYPDRYPQDFFPLPHPHEMTTRSNNMVKYMLIDVTNRPSIRFLAVAYLKEAAALGRIWQKTGGLEIKVPPLEGRGFSQFSEEEIKYLFWNATGQLPSDDFAANVQALKVYAELLKVDPTPLDVLEAEVKRLFPDEPVTTSNPSAEPRQPRAPAVAGERPKAGSTTGKVWELADGVLTSSGETDFKRLRPLIIKACTDAGINEATAATQYSKWKAAKSAAKAA